MLHNPTATRLPPRPLFLLALLIACNDPGVRPISSDFELEELGLTCTATSNGVSVLVEGWVHAPDDSFPGQTTMVDLAGSDRLTVSADGAAPLSLAPAAIFGDRLFGFLDIAASELDFELTRGGEVVSGSLTLPESFTLTAPAEPVPSSMPFDITWDATDAEGVLVTATVRGPCISRGYYVLEGDPGALHVDLPALFEAPPAGSCQLTVEVDRAETMLKLALGPGYGCSGKQRRAVAVEVVP